MKKPTNHPEAEEPHRWRKIEIGRELCRPPWVCLVLLCLSAAPLSAQEFGLFTYSVDGDWVTITDYPEDATGPVAIPAEIDGMPVTSIGFAGSKKRGRNNCKASEDCKYFVLTRMARS